MQPTAMTKTNSEKPLNAKNKVTQNLKVFNGNGNDTAKTKTKSENPLDATNGNDKDKTNSWVIASVAWQSIVVNF